MCTTQATQAALSWQHVGGDEARTLPVRVGRVARDPSAPSRSILGLGRAASAQRSSAAACKTCSEVPEEAQAAARRAGPARVGLWVHTGLARLLCALTSSRARRNRPLRCGGPVRGSAPHVRLLNTRARGDFVALTSRWAPRHVAQKGPLARVFKSRCTLGTGGTSASPWKIRSFES